MNYWIWTALFLLVEVLGISSAIHALFHVRTPQGTVAWVVGLVAFPWLALPLYWFFGSRRFDSHSVVMQQALIDHEAKLHHVQQEIRQFRVEPHRLWPRRLEELSQIAGDDFLSGNKLQLLVDGPQTFASILEAIGQARYYVYLEFYIMKEDGLGTRLLEALAERAAEGVKVYFLVDKFGSASMKPEVIAKWHRRGVNIATFCAHSRWRDRWRLNFRNHRKIVVVDGMVGFVGGHNVGDEYLGLNPKYGNWRDTHLRVAGPSVMQLQLIFAADWFFAKNELLISRWDVDASLDEGSPRTLILASGPSDHFERCTLFFLSVIASAEERLWIASPYFVPDESVLYALQLAALRGVKIRILLPMKPDQILVWLASFAMLTELKHANIEIYRYTHGFLHHKCLLVDRSLASVGTANFDNRSFRLNFEVTCLVADAEFVDEMEAMFVRDFARSRKIDFHDYENRPFYFKIAARGARLLAPIL